MNLEILAGAMLGHFVGDYLFQNQWMAIGKSQRGWHGTLACTVHVLLYTLAVALFTGWNPLFLAVIAVPHWIIDRWSLALPIMTLKNGYHPYTAWEKAIEPPPSDSLERAVAEDKLIKNVWKVSFTAPVYIFNDNTLHWVCIWLTVKYLFKG